MHINFWLFLILVAAAFVSGYLVRNNNNKLKL